MPGPLPEVPRTVCATVQLDLVASTAGDAIEKMAAGFGNFAPAARALAAAALEREAQASTYLGHGAALPHARLPGLPHLVVGFGRLRRPFAWTSGGDKVEFVFFGVVPAEQPRHYLAFMRLLALSLTNPERVAALRATADEASARAWLREYLQLQ
jgi:PTS system nitrogen regulatory IIA component